MTGVSGRPIREGAFRIGVGAGFSGDRFDPAEMLARHAGLDALAFECLAERTIAMAQERRISGTGVGFDPHLLQRLGGTLAPVRQGGGVLVTNAGAADPLGAAAAVKELAASLGLADTRVAAVTGDDVLAALDPAGHRVLGTDDSLERYAGRMISANAYVGAQPIVEALTADAQVVITGRCADAALFLGPLAHHFGWSDADDLAHGTLVGHLLECAGQLTGGYFADGDRKVVPDLANLGFPFADVTADGVAEYSKLDGTGGRIDHATVLEQLLYEIDDPAHYVTPDVTLDLRAVSIEQVGTDVVRVQGARAVGRPEMLKVSVGIRDGYIATGEVFYSGPRSLARARLAAAIIEERWGAVCLRDEPLQFAYVGINSTTPWTTIPDDLEVPEVCLRVSVRTLDEPAAALLCREVEALYTNGPAGGGGATASYRRTIGLVSTLVPREFVRTAVVFA